jgi:hypothetical protein
MTKQLLAGATALVLISGIASAQPYPTAPPPPPPVAPPPKAVSPPPPGPGTGGKEVTRKDIYREGVEGTSETHTKTKTNPETGTTTHSTTTTPHE